MGQKITWMIGKNITNFFKKIYIETMPDLIDLDHPATWIMDFNRFNNFVVFVNYFYLIL
jgi:hypothetical protein